jgi:penicillin-insensitive murein endopeptidase
MSKTKKLIIITGFSLLMFAVFSFYLGNDLLIMLENDSPSKSIGTNSDGKLINGKRLPNSGNIFIAYSKLGTLLGRNAVHNKLRDLILAAYKKIHDEYPQYLYVYGETGWVGGGEFYPHKTHQNGLSVDFMIPVKDINNKSQYLPAGIFNKFGYGIDFDDNGKYEDLFIDFKSMAVHINTLLQLSNSYGIEITRIIFCPKLQVLLWQTELGKRLRNKLKFSEKKSWVIHDDHYHIDFKLLERGN